MKVIITLSITYLKAWQAEDCPGVYEDITEGLCEDEETRVQEGIWATGSYYLTHLWTSDCHFFL